MPTTVQKTRMSFMTDKKAIINILAEADDRSKSYIINEALDEYLKMRTWQISHIKKAIIDADNNKFVKGSWTKTMDKLIAENK